MPERPRVTFDTDLRRRRLLVLLRAPAAIPTATIVVIWTLLAIGAVLVAWFFAIITRRVPLRLHRFLRAYVRYAAAASAWINLVTRGYPRVRRAGPVALEAAREPQSRVVTLLRPLVGLPALVLSSSLAVVLALSALAAWFVSLFRGRTTEGLRELGAFCVRYHAETLAFLLLVTPRAPRLGPPS